MRTDRWRDRPGFKEPAGNHVPNAQRPGGRRKVGKTSYGRSPGVNINKVGRPAGATLREELGSFFPPRPARIGFVFPAVVSRELGSFFSEEDDVPTMLSNVRRRLFLSALGMGLFASETSAFDEPGTSTSNPPSTQSTQSSATRPARKDAAVRWASTAAGEPVDVPTGQTPVVGVYRPLPSGQGMGAPMPGGPGMAPGGGFGTGSYEPGYGATAGSGATTPGVPGSGAPGTAPAQGGPFGGGAGGGDAEEGFSGWPAPPNLVQS